MAKKERAEADTLRQLEELRPAYERLRREAIRAEGDIERLTAELEAARAAAREALGTDHEAEIARLIAVAKAENAARVEAFAALVRGLEGELARLESEG
jgi:predicted  nucleic acid-binding Zn-ribbon protein